MRCIVTGYAGFIGTHLTKRLLEEGHHVIGIDAFIASNSKKLKEHPNLVQVCDDFIEYNPNVAALFTNVDYVFHLGAQGSVPRSFAQPGITFQRNFISTTNILEMAREHGVKRIIFSSSSSVYGEQEKVLREETMTPNPQSPYAISKMICEHYCHFYAEKWGLEYVALRYFNVYGPNQRSIGNNAPVIPEFVSRVINEEKCVINGTGETTRDFTYVTDVVEANMLASTTMFPNEIYNVATGNETSLKELHKMIYDYIKPSDLKLEFGPTRTGDVLKSKASIGKAETMLGFKAKVQIKEGLKKYIDSVLIK